MLIYASVYTHNSSIIWINMIYIFDILDTEWNEAKET